MLLHCCNIKKKYRFFIDVKSGDAINMLRKIVNNPHPTLLILDYDWRIDAPVVEYWYRKEIDMIARLLPLYYSYELHQPNEADKANVNHEIETSPDGVEIITLSLDDLN